MLKNRVYGDLCNINRRQFKEPNQICYAVFLSIHMCLIPFTTKVLLNRYKHIACMKAIHIVIHDSCS